MVALSGRVGDVEHINAGGPLPCGHHWMEGTVIDSKGNSVDRCVQVSFGEMPGALISDEEDPRFMQRRQGRFSVICQRCGGRWGG